VSVVSASGLARKDIFGASDPYVKVAIQRAGSAAEPEVVVTTQKKKRTLNPNWNETFTVDDPEGKRFLRGNRMVFSVFDANRLTRDDFLGQCDIPLSQLQVLQNLQTSAQPLISLDLRPRSNKSRVKGALSFRAAFVEASNEALPSSATNARNGRRVSPELKHLPIDLKPV